MKTLWTAKELASLAVDGYPATKQRMNALIKRVGITPYNRTGPGGGCKYHFESLPEPLRQAIIRSIIHDQPTPPTGETLPALVEAKPQALAVAAEPRPLPLASQLKDWQRRAMDARLAFVREIERLVGTGIRKEQAIRSLVELSTTGTLPEPLQALLHQANARSGSGQSRALSRRTLYRWMDDAQQGLTALAPVAVAHDTPAWTAALLKSFCVPQKPPLSAIVRSADFRARLPEGVTPPSYDAARRLLTKLSIIDVNRGRIGPRDLKKLRIYRVRDTSELWPADVYLSDGHTFDAEVAHPLHGRPFRPEITTVIDAATRWIPGWSVGLAENTWGVLDAFRAACESSLGIPAIWYTDRGSGFDNAAMTALGTGLIARIGCEHLKSLPYNSQARGISERSHQSVLVAAAQKLATYMGAQMDQEAKTQVYKITRREIKVAGKTALLPTWEQFIDLVSAEIAAYHDRPHRGLPKVIDPQTGQRRHRTPNEAVAQARAEGWMPEPIDPAQADDLFRPYVVRGTARGLVEFAGQQYFHRELEHWNSRERDGDRVLVGYDIHDPSRVWVRSLEGRLIGIALLNGNASGFVPKSVLERAQEGRTKAALARLERKADDARAELGDAYTGGATLEHQPFSAEDQALIDAEWTRLTRRVEPVEATWPEDEVIEPERRSVGETEPAPTTAASAARPVFHDDLDLWMWVEDHPDQATDHDKTYLARVIDAEPDLLLRIEMEQGRRRLAERRR